MVLWKIPSRIQPRLEALNSFSERQFLIQASKWQLWDPISAFFPHVGTISQSNLMKNEATRAAIYFILSHFCLPLPCRQFSVLSSSPQNIKTRRATKLKLVPSLQKIRRATRSWYEGLNYTLLPMIRI